MNLSKISNVRMENRWLLAGALSTVNGPVVKTELYQAIQTLVKIDNELKAGKKTRSCGIGKGSVSLAALKKAAQDRVKQLSAN